MEEIIEAIFEEGVFKPVKPPIGVAEHSHVKLTLRTDVPHHPLADCIGTISAEDADQMEKAIEEAFEQVETDE